MDPALQFVLLFSAATAVAIATRWLRLPYTVGLVFGGLALGALPFASPPHLTRDLLFAVALPGLLFEAAVHLREDDLAGSTLGIAALAVPGVVVILAITAAVMHAVVPRLLLVDALAFAAATVATDPIAVVATFRQVNAPARLAALVEGESLFNDGTGVVVFNLVVAGAAGAALTLGSAALQFVVVSAGGALIGGVLALLIVAVLRKAGDPMIEVTLTVIAAYGSFALAERAHASGVIATVVAGLVCGRAGRRGVPASLDALHTFWEYIAFALNSIVFLLIGLEVRPLPLLRNWAAILCAYAVVTAVRFLVVFAAAALLRRSRERQPWSWTLVTSWSGLRGALAMVLALSLPESFRDRTLIVHLTFGVVLLSIVVQGLTIGKLLRWLRIAEAAAPSREDAAAET